MRKMKRKETCKRPLVDRPNKERYLYGGEVSGVSGHMSLLKNLIFFFPLIWVGALQHISLTKLYNIQKIKHNIIGC